MNVEGGERREQQHQSSQPDTLKEGTAPREQIDLDTDHAILQAIVDTHENTITETTPLDEVQVARKKYKIAQVREAEKRVAQALIEEHRKEEPEDLDTTLRKLTPQGILSMKMDLFSGSISLYLDGKRSDGSRMTLLTNGYPLGEPKSGMEYMYGFADNRPGGVNQVVYDVGRMNQLPGHEPLDDIRHRWRGLRWMNANMLDWKNTNTIMPEELDPPIVSGSTSDENTPPPPQIP